jgi:hypothetical protein
MKMLMDDKTLTPNPTDFLVPESYQDWKSTMQKSFQEVLVKLLKYRFISPPTTSAVGEKLEIQLRVMGARELIAKDGRKRSSYCIIEYGGMEVKRKNWDRYETDAVDSLDPEWNQFLNLRIRSITDVIILSVGDRLKDHFLGQVTISVKEIVEESLRNGGIDRWMKLQHRDLKRKDIYVGGSIHVIVGLLEEDMKDSPMSYQKIQKLLDGLNVRYHSLYDILMRACLLLDIYTPRQRNVEVLSIESSNLLKCWASTWDISDVYQLTSHLKILFELFQQEKVSVFDILRVFHALYTHVKTHKNFSTEEFNTILAVLENIREKFCGIVVKYKEFFPENLPSKALESTVLVLRMIHKFPGYKEKHPEMKESPKDELRMILTEAAIGKFQRYKELTDPLDDSDANSVIEAIVKLAEHINEEIETDAKFYQSAFAQELDIVRLTAESLLKYFVLNLEDCGEVLSTDIAVSNAAEQVFALYKTIRMMSERYSGFG